MVEKNPPFAMPFMMTNAMSGPIELETGHKTSMLTALRRREAKSVFSGPNVSLQYPHVSRPSAEEKLNAATTPAPTEDFIPSEEVNRGRKKGGTKSGNVAIAPMQKRSVKRASRKRLLWVLVTMLYMSVQNGERVSTIQ
jgi:hypothetical protein